MFFKVTPLSSGFMLVSIIGFLVSSMYIYSLSATYGFTFSLFFILIFIAAMISMTLSPIEAEIDVKKERKRKIHKN